MFESSIDPRGAEAFPESWKEEFEGLLYLGYLHKEIKKIPFHTFVVKTLTVSDKLEINLAVKDYQDTLGYGRAYRAAVVAAGLESVDGRALLSSNRGSNTFRQKFEYVTNNWYDTVIDVLYQEIDQLEGKVLIVLRELNILPPLEGESPIFQDEKQSGDDPKGGK